MSTFQLVLTLALAATITLGAAFVLGLLQLAQRWMTLLEKAAERPVPRVIEPIPADLLAFSNQEDVPWAREDMRKHLYELYAEAGDWNKVRHALLQESS